MNTNDAKKLDLVNGLEVTIAGAPLALLASYQAKWEPNRSLTYVLEEALVAGLEAKRRSKEYSEATANQKAFSAALAADPTIATDIARMQALLRKYKIGGTKGAAVTSGDANSTVTDATQAA